MSPLRNFKTLHHHTVRHSQRTKSHFKWHSWNLLLSSKLNCYLLLLLHLTFTTFTLFPSKNHTSIIKYYTDHLSSAHQYTSLTCHFPSQIPFKYPQFILVYCTRTHTHRTHKHTKSLHCIFWPQNKMTPNPHPFFYMISFQTTIFVYRSAWYGDNINRFLHTCEFDVHL